MEISIFDAIGPVMIGPSSSHTAGAAKLGRMAALIIQNPFHMVAFGLHGSFAKTYQGHGTDKALVAGVLGLREDDENLKDSFRLAQERSMGYGFYEVELENVHENTVAMTFYMLDGTEREVVGSSVGGGQIVIRNIDGYDTDIHLNSSTLIIFQEDKVGVINDISQILVRHNINIGTMTVNRKEKGTRACCVIETDSYLSGEVVKNLSEVRNILQVSAVNI